MTICDKIQTVGETLESNLNARGVDCTFGTGTGEKNILQMTNLITSSNLKGSADSIISISASRPYLLSGEKTDLIVKLTNGLGQPLPNKSVSISDGTSVYTGITNNLGIFTLFNVGISATTTFTATYQSVSATCKVILATKRDYGTSSNHNDIWNNNSSTATYSFVREVAYTEMKELVSSNFGNDTSITAPCTIEFDYYQVDGFRSQAFFQILDSNNSALTTRRLEHIGGLVGEWVHLKLEISSNQLIFTNTDNNQSSTVTWSSGTPAKFNWWSSSDITAIRFKNFVIY